MNTDYRLVCLSERSIPNDFQIALNKLLSDFNLAALGTTQKIKDFPHSISFAVKAKNLNIPLFNTALITLSGIHRIDIALIPKEIYESKKGLVIFDMDSTLITAEVIDEMALKHGVGDKVKLITAKAMNGELNFDQSLTERVSLLKGFNRKHMEVILKDLAFTPGTAEFIKVLRSLGIKTAIASGGFQYFAKSIQSQLHMDYVFANDLEFEGEQLTGKIKGPIVNALRKKEITLELAQKEQLELNQVVAIGDGANDIPMLHTAGLGIAIHAKEKVQKSANFRINFGPMTHALGFMNHEAL